MSGTNSTRVTKGLGQGKKLDLDHISDIIKACAEHGVSVIKFGDLRIWFGPQANQPAQPLSPAAPVRTAHSNITPVAEMTDMQHDQQTKDALENEELELRQQQIAELMVTDPLKAEELIERGELQDADDEHGDGE